MATPAVFEQPHIIRDKSKGPVEWEEWRQTTEASVVCRVTVAIRATPSPQKKREGFYSSGYLLPVYDLILFFCQPCEMGRTKWVHFTGRGTEPVSNLPDSP